MRSMKIPLSFFIKEVMGQLTLNDTLIILKNLPQLADTQDLEKCSKEQIVNTYDNTILYTDFVINEAIKLLEKDTKNYQTLLFYVSDHGESLEKMGFTYMVFPIL